MVKINGFTFPEFMIVMAIIGILISVVFTPIYENDDDSADVDNIDSTMIINGIVHTCDEFGNCTAGK